MQEQHLMAAYYPNNVTTDHIQQYLDENKSLILKIVECQNSGKINECAENQARLQRNLMYLAAIADSQPQPTAMHQQLASPSGMMQTGAHYTQQHQHAAQQMTPQSLMAVRSSMLYSQQPFAALQQHQAALHGHLGTSSAGLHMLQSGEGSKQDIGNAGSGEGRGGSSGGQSGETHYLKSADDVN